MRATDRFPSRRQRLPIGQQGGHPAPSAHGGWPQREGEASNVPRGQLGYVVTNALVQGDNLGVGLLQASYDGLTERLGDRLDTERRERLCSGGRRG